MTFLDRGRIPSSNGSHTMIIDLTDGGTAFTGNWKTLRWDFFNTSGNGGGKTFTIDKVTFANEIVAIPEPSSALLCVLALPTLIRRKRG